MKSAFLSVRALRFARLILLGLLPAGFYGCEDTFEYQSRQPQQDPSRTVMEYLRSDTTLETMVQAIERTGLEPVFSGPGPVTLFAVNDLGWRNEFRRSPSGGRPNPYRNKTLNDIPVDVLRNFVLSMTIPKELYSTSLPYPFDVREPTLAPNATLRVEVRDNRYELRLNAEQNPAAGSGGRTQYRSNAQQSNGVVHVYPDFYSALQ